LVGSTRRITLLPDSSQFMLALQPDLQYVITADTTRAIPNGLALQLRFEITFWSTVRGSRSAYRRSPKVL
jgi:hypothetical protein